MWLGQVSDPEERLQSLHYVAHSLHIVQCVTMGYECTVSSAQWVTVTDRLLFAQPFESWALEAFHLKGVLRTFLSGDGPHKSWL